MKLTRTPILFWLTTSALLSASDIPAQPSSPLAPSSTYDLKFWVSVVAACGALGTLVTAALNLIRWRSERSQAARKLETITYSTKLREFIAAAEISTVPRQETPRLRKAIEAARMELRTALEQVGSDTPRISSFRRSALLYAPKNRLAWFPHSLFYAFCMLIPVFTFDVFITDDSGLTFAEGCWILIVFVALALLFQRWGALERRLADRIKLPANDVGPFRWYPANSRYGFLAQLMMFMGLLTLATPVMLLLGGAPEELNLPPVPQWVLALKLLVFCSFLPLGYYWAKIEFVYSQMLKRKARFRHFKRFVSNARRTEQYVGLAALAALFLWTLILLCELRFVPWLAALPSSEGEGTTGWLLPTIHFLLAACVGGAWPLLAVYRGFWALDERWTSISEADPGRNEVRRG